MSSRQPADAFHSINLSGGKWDWAIVADGKREELARARIECKRTWNAVCQALIAANSGTDGQHPLSLLRRFNWPSGISNDQVVRMAVGGKLAGKCDVKLDGEILAVINGAEAKLLLSRPILQKLPGPCQLEVVLSPDLCNPAEKRNPVSGAWIRIEQ